MKQLNGKIESRLKASKRRISILTIMIFIFSFFFMSIPTMADTTASGYWTDGGNYSTTAPSLSGTTYTINNAEQLAWVSDQASQGNTFLGYTIILGNDIDLSDEWRRNIKLFNNW